MIPWSYVLLDEALAGESVTWMYDHKRQVDCDTHWSFVHKARRINLADCREQIQSNVMSIAFSELMLCWTICSGLLNPYLFTEMSFWQWNLNSHFGSSWPQDVHKLGEFDDGQGVGSCSQHLQNVNQRVQQVTPLLPCSWRFISAFLPFWLLPKPVTVAALFQPEAAQLPCLQTSQRVSSCTSSCRHNNCIRCIKHCSIAVFVSAVVVRSRFVLQWYVCGLCSVHDWLCWIVDML